jgi:peptidoglycan/LPS O-acetylase OafA/YrhL
MQTAIQPKRLEILDLARGVGFMIVLFVHCIGFLGGVLLMHLMPQDATILDFFFLLSGFFAGYAHDNRFRNGQKSVAQACCERIIRIYPMIVLGTIIGALVAIPDLHRLGHIIGIPTISDAIARGVLLLPSHIQTLNYDGSDTLFPLDVPLWFVFLDTVAYLLFLLVLRKLTLTQLAIVAAFALIGFVGGVIRYNGVDFGPYWADLPWSLPRVLYEFTFGYILFKLSRNYQFTIAPRYAALPLLAIVVAIFLPLPASSPYSGALQLFIAIVVMPLIILVGAKTQAGPRLAPWSALAARFAYPVYALHFPIVWFLSNFRWTLHLHGVTGILLLVIEFLSPLLVAFCATALVDEPVRRFFLAKIRARETQRNELLSAGNG